MTIFHVIKYKGGWPRHGLSYPIWALDQYREKLRNLGDEQRKQLTTEQALEILDQVMLEYDPEAHGEQMYDNLSRD